MVMVQDEPCVSNFRRTRSSALPLSARHVNYSFESPGPTQPWVLLEFVAIDLGVRVRDS